jgi:4-amino-4-deoxychorismate lyase
MSAAAAGCWIDGEPATGVPVDDRGLLYGDGVFETLAWRGGVLRFVDLHLARLRRGLETLGIAAPSESSLRGELSLACGPGDAIVKLLVTRGSGGRGYAPPRPAIARRILYRYPWPVDPRHWWQDGVEIVWSPITISEQPALAGLKHLNRLDQVLARDALQGSDDLPPAQEALLCTSAAMAICGTMTNVFAVEGHTLLTPTLARAGVAGVMRAVILREAPALGLRVVETDLPRDLLDSAAEVFVSNARIGIWPVRRLGGRRLLPGATTLRLQQHIAGLSE